MNQGPYFYLHPQCNLVMGQRNGAVYDLFLERLFWIQEPKIAASLQRLVGGATLRVAAQAVGTEIQTLEDYCRALEALGYGKLIDKRMHVDPYHPVLLKSQIIKLELPQPLLKATIQISDRCTYACSFCQHESGFSMPLCMCGCWPMGECLSAETISCAVKDLIDLGCQRFEVQGGDPMLAGSRLWSLLEQINYAGIPVRLHTTGFLLDEISLSKLADLGVELVIPVFSYDPVYFDSISGCPGSYEALTRVLMYIREHKAPALTLKVFVFPETLSHLSEFGSWLKKQGAHNLLFERIIPANKASWSVLFNSPEYADCLLHSAFQFKPNIGEFFALKEGHACFRFCLALCADGKVMPCIAARDLSVANIQDSSLPKILREQRLRPYWNDSPDFKEKCKGCEFRYACTHCALRKKLSTHEDLSPIWNCMYDPSSGNWNKTITEPR